jgi:hypothetical protein
MNCLTALDAVLQPRSVVTQRSVRSSNCVVATHLPGAKVRNLTWHLPLVWIAQLVLHYIQPLDPVSTVE